MRLSPTPSRPARNEVKQLLLQQRRWIPRYFGVIASPAFQMLVSISRYEVSMLDAPAEPWRRTEEINLSEGKQG